MCGVACCDVDAKAGLIVPALFMGCGWGLRTLGVDTKKSDVIKSCDFFSETLDDWVVFGRKLFDDLQRITPR